MGKVKINLSGFFQTVIVKSICQSFSIILFTLLSCISILGQYNEVEFERIAIEQGLSQGSVNCILQDEKGLMWFGTQTGLNRYDGHEFKIYTPNSIDTHSLSHTIVLSLFRDSNGILWVGTYGGGLNKFDSKNEKFFNYVSDPQQYRIFNNQNVFAINEDNNDTLWVGTDKGLYIKEKDDDTFSSILNLDGNTIEKVKVIYKDKNSDNIIWIGAEKGLYKYDQTTRKFSVFKISQENSFKNEVLAIVEIQDDVLWIGASSGLFLFNKKNNRFRPYPESLINKRVNSLFKDNNGIIWIGTRTDGLIYIDLKKESFKTFKNIPNDLTTLSSNNISTIYQDKSGLLWIGTIGGGINRYNPSGIKFTLYKNNPLEPASINQNDIRGICEDQKGMIWIGTNGGGINRFDPQDKTFKHYLIGEEVSKNHRRNDIHCIYADHDNKLWVGTSNGGLYIFDPDIEKFRHYNKEPISPNEYVLEIREDEKNRLWIGTLDNGLIVLDESREKYVNFKNDPDSTESLSNNKIFSLFPVKNNILWIGTGGGGLNKLVTEKIDFSRKKGKKFTHFMPNPNEPKKDDIGDSFISAIHRDKNGTLWLGSTCGLNQLIDEKKKSFKIFTVKDGLPDNTIYAILEDNEGNLWLSTNRGLAKFNPKTKRFCVYSPYDGLQGYEFNRSSAWKSRKGLMYFGGFNGFNQFNPKEIPDEFPSPSIVITSFKKLNDSTPLGANLSESGELKLSYRDSFFSFGFAALSFSDTGNNRYAYKLGPIDKEWNNLGNKHNIDFINIKPGNYELRIKGANSHGIWSENDAVLKISISPPFWKTWWFTAICVAFVIIGILFYIKFRTKKMGRLNKWLEKQVSQRTEKIRQQKEELNQANIKLKDKIEERKQAVIALKDSEERYRTLVETSPDAIVLCDIKGNISMANRQTCNLLGYSNKEVLEDVKNILRFLPENERSKARKCAQKVIREGITNNVEFTLIAKDGTAIPVEISTSCIKDEEGNPKYFIEMARDIRKRKKAEHEEKLRQERLLQVDKMASLGRLVSGVAHELNNPASSLKMNSEIFDRVWRDVTPALEEHFKKNEAFSMAGVPYADAKSRLDDLILGFMESSQRIEKIIKDLKDFSRPGDNITSEPVDINKVVRSSVNLTHNLLKKSTKNHSLELTENLPSVLGNPQKLEQVMINLIQNACHALSDKNQAIFITTKLDKGKNFIVLMVKDEGKGIEEEHLKYIMDPFYTTRREIGGTGLGLSISQQIIRDHGGTISFKSQVGKGTTVMIKLPVINTPS